MPQATRTLLAVAAAVMTTAGCGWTEGHPDLITLEEAGAPPGPAPYWVGQEFEGLPLTAIARPPSVIVHYGECAYEASEEDDYGCGSPLRIENRPIAGGPADWTDLSCRRVTVRGVAAPQILLVARPPTGAASSGPDATPRAASSSTRTTAGPPSDSSRSIVPIASPPRGSRRSIT